MIKSQIQWKAYQYNYKKEKKKVETFYDKTEDFCITFLNKLGKFMWKCENLKIFVVIFTDTMVGIQINNIVEKGSGDIFW